MSLKNQITELPSLVPDEFLELFGDAPLLQGEKVTVYNSMMDRFVVLVDPQDAIQWFWVKDMTDHTWEIRRLRRFKVLLIELDRDSEHSHREQYANYLRMHLQNAENHEHEPVPVRDSEKDSAGFFKDHIKDYKSIDSLIASAELRRDRTLREIERRRENLARRLQKASDEIVEEELEDKSELPRAA
jgi:hypothetical protein